MNLGFLINSEKFQKRLFAINRKITKLSFKLIKESINKEEYLNSLIDRFESSNNQQSNSDDGSSINIYHKFNLVELIQNRIHHKVHFDFFNFWKSVNCLIFYLKSIFFLKFVEKWKHQINFEEIKIRIDWHVLPSYFGYSNYSNKFKMIDSSYEFINTINFANVKSLEFAFDINCEEYFDDKFISFFDENLNTSKIQNFSILSRGGYLSEDFFPRFFLLLGKLKNMHALKFFFQ